MDKDFNVFGYDGKEFNKECKRINDEIEEWASTKTDPQLHDLVNHMFNDQPKEKKWK